MPVPLRRSPASAPACVNSDDIARFYSRPRSGKIIDADLFVDCFFEANDDPLARHPLEWYFVHSRTIGIKVPWGVRGGPLGCFFSMWVFLGGLSGHRKKIGDFGGKKVGERGKKSKRGGV